jgi:hypothetical protein
MSFCSGIRGEEEKEAEEVEEAKEVEDNSSRENRRERKALRAEGMFLLKSDPQEFSCFTSG